MKKVQLMSMKNSRRRSHISESVSRSKSRQEEESLDDENKSKAKIPIKQTIFYSSFHRRNPSDSSKSDAELSLDNNDNVPE